MIFENQLLSLPTEFYAELNPTPVKNPRLIKVNAELSDYLNIDRDWLTSAEALKVFAGNAVITDSRPTSSVYAGHQFGHWNPQLGDGRALLIGEARAKDGIAYDIQLKGSGETPFSRAGDGRSPLGPVLREFIVSEAMHALGVPTTRALAAVTTGEKVVRDSLLPGAVLTRVARSHIRVGTFQFFSAQNNVNAVKALADFVIERHYPEAVNSENPYADLLNLVIKNQAKLIAKWQLLGFVHGVMNTDNMLVSGETIDYGPCAFMDEYNPNLVLSSIDHHGRYQYRNQPKIAQWNLSWFAQSLIPLLDSDEKKAIEIAQESISQFTELYEDYYQTGLHKKLGLSMATAESQKVVEKLLNLMAQERVDFTLTFRTLASELTETDQNFSPAYELPMAFLEWKQAWKKQLDIQGIDLIKVQTSMLQLNPVFIPRNHLVEQVIDKATNENDFKPFHKLVGVLEKPFDYTADFEIYTRPAEKDQVVTQTFCGT